ncbi:MAG: biotin--[acetyl-CoA-carboxylase] ligase [Fidelibacterota bacterium]
MFTNLLQANLTTRILGRNIEQVTLTKSTNDDAWELIDKGVEEGTLVITDKQTAGKGRSGRRWISVPGKSLTMSLLLKPELDSRFAGWFPLMAGIAVSNALAELGLKVDLKWPNDIMVNKKKLGGILCESRIQGSCLIWVVIGIGININEQKIELSKDLNATSFFMESSSSIQRELVSAFVLNHLEILYALLKRSRDVQTLSKFWTDRCNHINKNVKFETGCDTHEGIFLGINADGAALINCSGNEIAYSSSDIHIIE